MKNGRKKLGVLLLILALLCIGYIVYYEVSKSANENIYAKVQKQVAEDKKQKLKPGYISPIDFDKLKETNQDIYAWIEIPDTQINYPVVQSGDDDAYYLNHTIDGTEGYPGSIYTERINAKDFSDFNTVIYGHNMKDGSMFMGLHNFEDPQYMKEHPNVKIYTPEKELTYRIFAAVVYDDVHILEAYDFSSQEYRRLFLESVYNSRDMRNCIDESVAVDADSKILTLSTCIGGENNKRYIVEAVLVDE